MAGVRRSSPGSPALIIIIIALPFFSMRLGSSDAGTNPSSTTTRKAYDLLGQGLDAGRRPASAGRWDE